MGTNTLQHRNIGTILCHNGLIPIQATPWKIMAFLTHNLIRLLHLEPKKLLIMSFEPLHIQNTDDKQFLFQYKKTHDVSSNFLLFSRLS
jgi:hypothetical protein